MMSPAVSSGCDYDTSIVLTGSTAKGFYGVHEESMREFCDRLPEELLNVFR